MDEILNIVGLLARIIIIGVIVFRLFRILRPFEKGLIERFGKYNREQNQDLI